MSIFQCEHCGCAENTALTDCYHCRNMTDLFDWTGIEDRKGKALCSACSPVSYSDGGKTEGGGNWHGEFDRVFLPMGQFVTDRFGNLKHKATGETNYRKMALRIEE